MDTVPMVNGCSREILVHAKEAEFVGCDRCGNMSSHCRPCFSMKENVDGCVSNSVNNCFNMRNNECNGRCSPATDTNYLVAHSDKCIGDCANSGSSDDSLHKMALSNHGDCYLGCSRSCESQLLPSEDGVAISKDVGKDVSANIQDSFNGIVAEKIFSDANTCIDYSCLELNSVPDHLYSLSSITELCLDFNDFLELPDKFFERFSSLRVLSLLGNCLLHLPESISFLTELRELCIAQNSLLKLPPSIGALRRLKVINISQNRISELPPELGQLAELERFSACENLLQQLPHTIGRLNSLVSLDLRNNRLKTLPCSFGFLINLKNLNLSSNGLSDSVLPESVACLTALECLDISKNLLTRLPDVLKCWPKLKHLQAAENQIESLPSWIDNLPALEELHLGSNRLIGSPLSDNFSRGCRQLRVLGLGRNFIRNISDSFVEMEKLEWLDLSNDEDLIIQKHSSRNSPVGNWICCLPPYFGSLQQLKHINMYSIKLERLPDDIGLLKNLEWLNLGANYLHDLPESFCQLTSLKYLVLSKNSLELLPTDFGCLLQLEDLRLDSNSLAELPQSFCHLVQLHRLNLSSNQLTELPVFLEDFARLKFVSLDENYFSGRLVLSGNRNQEIEPRTSLPIKKLDYVESEWLENEDVLEEHLPNEDVWHSREAEVDDRPSSAGAGAGGLAFKLEEEEDWDAVMPENGPSQDCGEAEIQEQQLDQSCSVGSHPTFSFVPSMWHAPRVNTYRGYFQTRLNAFSSSRATTLADQFEDAEES